MFKLLWSVFTSIFFSYALLAFTVVHLAFFGLRLLLERSKSYTVHTRGAIIVSGASQGIGRSIALTLARHGFVVFAGVRHEADGQDLLQAAQSMSATASHRNQKRKTPLASAEQGESRMVIEPVMLEVRSDESVRQAVARVRARMPELGVDQLVGVVSNAGISTITPIEGMPMAELQEEFDVNCAGGVRLIQQCLPELRKSKGRVIWVSSANGLITVPCQGAYSASKHAVEALADTLRLEVASSGVSVSLIEPGLVHTDIIPKMLHGRQEYAERMGGSIPGDPTTTTARKNDTDFAPSTEDEKNRAELLQLYDPWLQYTQNHLLQISHSRLCSEPEDIADTVYSAMTDARPFPRYIVGKTGLLFVWARFHLPDRMWDLYHDLRRRSMTTGSLPCYTSSPSVSHSDNRTTERSKMSKHTVVPGSSASDHSSAPSTAPSPLISGRD